MLIFHPAFLLSSLVESALFVVVAHFVRNGTFRRFRIDSDTACERPGPVRQEFS